ncbi:MAG: DNA/RNA nuclease SfsA [Shewanella sp.]|nr:DNA/RNA nuclease SfsA [Shewanella sp.]
MEFIPKLESGILIKRYKRFLADIRLNDGSEVTIHCPNTGSMKNCQFPEQQVWFSTSDNPKRKYSRTWELMETPVDDFIGINTGRANQLAADAIEKQVITELVGYEHIKREVKYGAENSRIDILLTSDDKPDCYVEVKSCTLLETGSGYFPDSVTLRGQKHLRELMQMVQNGHRAVLLFVVQHSGISTVSPAKHIDPAYASLFYEAIAQGVEVLAYKTTLSPDEIIITDKILVI